MERLTFEGRFCDIAKCSLVPGGSFCESGSCSQRQVWERLKIYEDTGLCHETAAQLKQLAEIFNCDPNDPAQLKQLCDKLRGWQQAERAGRLVVLPEASKKGDPVPDCFYNYDGGDLCMGMAKSVHDDEPTEKCKRCWYCESTRQEAEAAVELKEEN